MAAHSAAVGFFVTTCCAVPLELSAIETRTAATGTAKAVLEMVMGEKLTRNPG
jgi:hypothetical protein